MSDRSAAMRRAVLENPFCETARLVYADALDEDADAADEDGDRDWLRLEADYVRHNVARPVLTRFVAGHAALPWLADPAPWPESCSFLCCSGFVFGVRATTAAFLRHGLDLFRRHPIKRVDLYDRDPSNSGTSRRPEFRLYGSEIMDHFLFRSPGHESRDPRGPCGLSHFVPRCAVAAVGGLRAADLPAHRLAYNTLYATSAETLDYLLSIGLVNACRAAVGLPELDWSETSEVTG